MQQKHRIELLEADARLQVGEPQSPGLHPHENSLPHAPPTHFPPRSPLPLPPTHSEISPGTSQKPRTHAWVLLCAHTAPPPCWLRRHYMEPHMHACQYITSPICMHIGTSCMPISTSRMHVNTSHMPISTSCRHISTSCRHVSTACRHISTSCRHVITSRRHISTSCRHVSTPCRHASTSCCLGTCLAPAGAAILSAA